MSTQDRSREARIAALVKAYMEEQMAMPDAATDQEQNWIAGHMHTFAHRVLVDSSLSERRCWDCGAAITDGDFDLCEACDDTVAASPLEQGRETPCT